MAATSSDSDSSQLPGRGLMGWLGRQVGYISRAIKTEVVPGDSRRPEVDSAALHENVLYRVEQTREAPHPTQPEITLRRRTIDEAVKSDR